MRPPQQNPPPVSVTTPTGLRLHSIQTGWVAVKAAHRQFTGPDGTGLAAIALDPRWTEWLPIHTWVIEHPEGMIVIDTGETARMAEKDYTTCDPGTNFFYRSFLRFNVTPEEEIGAQLRTLGIPPAEVRWVVQTHLHSDHVGGLSAFSQSDVLVPSQDYPSALGTLYCRYPDWLNPTRVEFTPGHLPGHLPHFPRTKSLTRAGDVLIVPTPGHTEGHQSVVLLDGDTTYFFAGDTSFTEAQLLAGKLGGIALKPREGRETMRQIRAYAGSRPTVYLPSHDPDSRRRLLEQATIQS
ncbi:MAG: N-acyl homoserine lactonase family protein [bacterium]|nr:N-acyl homoserine lactonase family protein [bacterium]